jgi:hypothetical protein
VRDADIGDGSAEGDEMSGTARALSFHDSSILD